MRKRLLTVQGPLQFITGYIAFTSPLPGRGDDGPTEDVLLLYDFLCDPALEDAIAESVRQLSGVQPWSRVVLIRGSEMATLMRARYSTCIRRLHGLLGHERFDEIYLARDHIGHGSPLLMNAYPEAVKRAYGDSFGLVGQHTMVKKPTDGTPILATWARRAKALARHVLVGVPRDIPFDEAVLTLPMDASGRYFATTPLRVPERPHVVACVERLYAAMPALANHCKALCQQGSGLQDHLYLLSNLTASTLASLEQEIALYVEVIESTSPPGSTAFIKPHPRSSHEVLQAVVRQVGARCRVVVLDDVEFGRTPIELWVELVRHCTVVAIFSTSATHLKYLYGKEVVMPLTPQRIERFIPPHWFAFMTKGDRMIRESVENLATWDGRSALWSAPEEEAA
jgi:hypothetical protein